MSDKDFNGAIFPRVAVLLIGNHSVGLVRRTASPTLSMEQLADLRDKVITTLDDRRSARQRKLQRQIGRLGGVVSSEPRKQSTARPKRPVKYRDGQNEWSGCGTMPAWGKANHSTHRVSHPSLLKRFRRSC
jgi:DNA-binding protein H-NS